MSFYRDRVVKVTHNRVNTHFDPYLVDKPSRIIYDCSRNIWRFIMENTPETNAIAILEKQNTDLKVALLKALLWTDEEYDVGQWREEAQKLIDSI